MGCRFPLAVVNRLIDDNSGLAVALNRSVEVMSSYALHGERVRWKYRCGIYKLRLVWRCDRVKTAKPRTNWIGSLPSPPILYAYRRAICESACPRGRYAPALQPADPLAVPRPRLLSRRCAGRLGLRLSGHYRRRSGPAPDDWSPDTRALGQRHSPPPHGWAESDCPSEGTASNAPAQSSSPPMCGCPTLLDPLQQPMPPTRHPPRSSPRPGVPIPPVRMPGAPRAVQPTSPHSWRSTQRAHAVWTNPYTTGTLRWGISAARCAASGIL